MPPRATGFRRPITLLFVRTADADGVRDALDARRTAAWLGDDVWGPEELLKGLWDGAISVQPDLRRTPGAGPDDRLSTTNPPFQCACGSDSDRSGCGAARVVPAQGEFAMAVGFEKSAPMGTDFTIELDVTNLHTAPDKNLVVRVSATHGDRRQPSR